MEIQWQRQMKNERGKHKLHRVEGSEDMERKWRHLYSSGFCQAYWLNGCGHTIHGHDGYHNHTITVRTVHNHCKINGLEWFFWGAVQACTGCNEAFSPSPASHNMCICPMRGLFQDHLILWAKDYIGDEPCRATSRACAQLSPLWLQELQGALAVVAVFMFSRNIVTQLPGVLAAVAVVAVVIIAVVIQIIFKEPRMGLAARYWGFFTRASTKTELYYDHVGVQSGWPQSTFEVRSN